MKYKVIKFKPLLKRCVCPYWGKKQKFKYNGSYFKIVKNINPNYSLSHVMKMIHCHLNRAMAEYRRLLKESGIDTLDIWSVRWIILKNIEGWAYKEHQIYRRNFKKIQRYIN